MGGGEGSCDIVKMVDRRNNLELVEEEQRDRERDRQR